jgi:hypothetical protein
MMQSPNWLNSSLTRGTEAICRSKIMLMQPSLFFTGTTPVSQNER